MNEIDLKILLVGDTSVGKTSILSKYIDDIFEENHISTIGVEYKVKSLCVNERKIKLCIWDSSGQDRFRSITQSFFRNADGILFIFDLTEKNTFEGVKQWLIDSESYDLNIKKILVGNKVDLIEKRKVEKEIIDNFVNRMQLKYYEMSAKDGTNVDNVFRELAEMILSGLSEKDLNEKLNKEDLDKINNGSFIITNPGKKTKKQCC
jgi:Ras-related protein Rab-1A